MAGRGRGRGRGLLTAAKPSAPGGGNDTEAKSSPEGPPRKESQAAETFKELETELAALSYDPSDSDLQKIERLAATGMVTLEDIQRVAKVLYERVMENQELSKAAAMVCDKLANLDREGTRFRSTILSLLQVDYKGREELRKTSRTRFLGFVSFLTHLFGTMRLGNGEVMLPLVGPVYDCCELIVDNDCINEDECTCLSQQLQQVGREMQDNGEDRMLRLMDTCRTKIISEQTKPQVRCILLELLEHYLRRWQVAPNDVTRFYCDTEADIMAGLVLSS